MMRVTPNANNQLVLYRPANTIPPRRSAAPAPSDSTEGSSSDSDAGAEKGEPMPASLSERANFIAGRAWNFLTDDVADLKGFKYSVSRLARPEWYDRFTSDSPTERAQAYWDFRDDKAGVLLLTKWDRFTDRTTRLQETRDIVKLHFVLSHLFGDMPYADMREAAYAKELKLAPNRVKGHYQGRILSASYTMAQGIPGEVHEREAGYVAGAVKAAREMYNSVRVCLDNPGVRRKLALVPRKYYEEFLPKKAPSLVSLELDTALPIPPGPSLLQSFKLTMAEMSKLRPPSPSEEFEMVDWTLYSLP